jgi:hypothetical protein
MYPKHKPKPVFLQGEIDTAAPETLFQQLDNKINRLFKLFNLKTLLHRAGIQKAQGFSAYDLLYLRILHPFFKKNRTALWSHEDIKNKIQAHKDTFYRFVGKEKYNWRNLIYRLFLQIQRHLSSVPYEERLLIADTTIIQKTGHRIELVSRMYDYVSKRYVLGFPSLFLGYFDGRSFFPFDFAISATKNRPNEHEKNINKRSGGYRRRQEAKNKTTDILISMIQKAYQQGIEASYVLFDSWFSHDIVMKKVLDIGYHVICRCKIGKVKYCYQGHDYTPKQLFSKIMKKRIKWNPELGFYAASILVNLPHTGTVKLVFCQPERRKKFALFLSTDVDLEITDILRKYSHRWSIEMFFRDAKQRLGLGKEQNRDFDAIIAHQSFLVIRYLLLSFLIRHSTGREPLGPLFESISDQIVRTTILSRLWKFFKHLILMSSQVLFAENESHFIDKLIDYMENIINVHQSNMLLEGAKV